MFEEIPQQDSGTPIRTNLLLNGLGDVASALA